MSNFNYYEKILIEFSHSVVFYFNKNITSHQKAMPNIRTEATGVRSNICTNSFFLLLDLHLSMSLKGSSEMCTIRCMCFISQHTSNE